ncbi:NTP transferase domain-containing protein [Chitinophaga lutea]
MILADTLRGLVLCGGRSTRMRQDKSRIRYHDGPQWSYLRQLLLDELEEVYISCRRDQVFPGCEALIIDSVDSAGPATGLLSAYKAFPDSAWLVLACDLPLIDATSIRMLLRHRDRRKAATAFLREGQPQPEPLVAIWEPAGLLSLQQAFLKGKNCPGKTLLSADIVTVTPPADEALFNANTPADMQTILQKLN